MSGNFSVSASSVPVLTSLAATVPPILTPEIARGLHVGTAATALAIAAFTLGLAVTTPMAGRVVDRWGTTSSLRAGAALLTGASLLAALAPDLAVLIAARLAQATGSAAISVGAFALIARAPQPRSRARRLGTLTAGTSVMYSCGPLIGAALAATGTWRAGLLAPAAAAAAALLVSRDRHSGFTGHRLPHHGWSTRSLRPPRVARLLLGGSSLNAASLASAFLAPLMLRQLHPHATVATVGLWLLPAVVIPVVVALLAGRSTIPAGRVLGGLGLLAAVSLVLAGTLPSVLTIVLASGAATAGFAGTQVLLLSRLPEHAPLSEVGTVLGWITLGMLLGGTIGTSSAGLLQASVGSSYALLIVAAVPLLALCAWTCGDGIQPGRDGSSNSRVTESSNAAAPTN